VNEDDYDAIKKRMPSIIESYAGTEDPGPWAWSINKRIGSYNTGLAPKDALIVLDKLSIPNPDGEDIEILIKRIDTKDFEIDADEDSAWRMTYTNTDP